MEEWKTYKYTELCTLIGGGTPKTTVPDYWDGNIPWLSVKDFGGGKKYVYSTEKTITELGLNNSSTKLLEKDDIIISARGTVGEIAMIPSNMAFNQSCFGIRAKADLIDPHYLYYLTKTKVAELKKASHGSVFDTITRDTFDGISCELPDLNTQKQVSQLLSSIDSKIDLNNRINHNLAC
ncbi:MAG: restriction endonuclease subunit S [Candidatus Cryptobacteroides sp.]